MVPTQLSTGVTGRWSGRRSACSRSSRLRWARWHSRCRLPAPQRYDAPAGAFSIRFRSGVSQRGSAWCCSRRWPATVTTPSFSSGHSFWSMHRPSSGLSCSSSADCRPLALQPQAPPRTLHDAGRRDRDHRPGAAARGSGPTPLCVGHAALPYQARTRVHRRSGVHQNARRRGRHLCPHSDGPDEQAGRRCDKAGRVGWSAGLPGAGEHPGQQRPGTPHRRRATAV